ncbi:MAG TPA: TadE/TadG family type IV pilus assembly protein [Alphaproteobacteria bacterium]
MAAVEFAFVASFLTMALMGGTELARYTLMNQKMDRVSSSVADWVAQSSTLASTDFDNFFGGAQQVARPFELGSKGRVIISFIVAETDTTYRISWQRSGAGTLAETSLIGTEGGLATLPAGVTLAKGDYVVAVEVYAQYEAFIFPDLVGTSVVYKRSFEQPRLPDIITVTP